MAKPRNVVLEIVLSLLAAVVFGSGLYVYISNSMPAIKPVSVLTSSSAAAGPNDLDLANALAQRFVGELRAQRYDAAYALMAAPYRDAFSEADFRKTCTASPFLAKAQRTMLSRTSRIVPPGSDARAASLRGIGSIASAVGSIEATFTFLPEQDALRILVLSIAGIPVLDGVSGKR